jgi:hypothetical protein
MIGLMPISISFNAANNPAGPAPIITTFLVACCTFLKLNSWAVE